MLPDEDPPSGLYKKKKLDDYLNMQLDSLQVQINQIKVKLEQLERRFKRMDNRVTIHLNDKQGHSQKIGVNEGGIDV